MWRVRGRQSLRARTYQGQARRSWIAGFPHAAESRTQEPTRPKHGRPGLQLVLLGAVQDMTSPSQTVQEFHTRRTPTGAGHETEPPSQAGPEPEPDMTSPSRRLATRAKLDGPG